MKRIMVFISLLFLMGGSAYGDPATPLSTEGSQIRQGKEEFPPKSSPRFGPPPEAFKACEGKTEGITAQFTGPNGETVKGICRIADGRLVLRPDHPPGNTRDGHHGPAPEAYKACEGKSAGSSAQFVNPRGKVVKGTCEEKDGKLLLRPDILKGDRQGNVYDRPGNSY